MPTFQIAQDFNAKFAPSYVPVFVIFGGTAGIGRAMVEAFAKYTKGNAHIIIAGRNKTAAEEIIAKLPKPESQFLLACSLTPTPSRRRILIDLYDFCA